MNNLSFENINFLVADDHSLIRQGIQFIIEELDFQGNIYQASTLHNVLQTVEEQTIDIAIMDAVFPDGNSISCIPEIKKIQPNIKILIYSGLEEDIHAIHYIKAGADGFLSKLCEEQEIKEAILKIFSEGNYFSPLTQDILLKSVFKNNFIDAKAILSEREFQIAELYVKGLGNLEIAIELNLKQNTVSTIKKRIFDKLQIDNIVELVELMSKVS